MRAELSRMLEDFFGVPAHLVGSGTVALTLALKAIGVRGEPVAIPAITCPNVAVAVVAAGGDPVLVDVRPDDLTISAESLKGCAEERPLRAVIAVDPFGIPADIRALESAVASRDAVIIEDASQAYGGRDLEGLPLGARAPMGVVSFGYAKPVSLSGGGAILTRGVYTDMVQSVIERALSSSLVPARNALAVRLMRSRRDQLLVRLARWTSLFAYDFPASLEVPLKAAWQSFVFQAGSASAVLREVIAHLGRIPGARTVGKQGTKAILPWRPTIVVEDPLRRLQIRQHLELQGVPTSAHYAPIHRLFPERFAHVPLPVAEALEGNLLNLIHVTTVPDSERLAQGVERALAELTAAPEDR